MVKECNITEDGITYIYSSLASPTAKRAEVGAANEIIYITAGEGRVLEGTELLPFSSGTLFIFPKGCATRIIPDADRPPTAHIIRFDRSDLLADTARMYAQTVGDSTDLRYYSVSGLPVGALSVFERLPLVSRYGAKERATYLKLLLSELVFLLHYASPKRLTAASELGARVYEYLCENISSDLSLDTLAGIFFVSKCHLCRAFKKYSGRSLHSFVSESRLSLAKRLIENGETASDAAYKVGFGDYSAFYRAYVKLFGISPSESGEVSK